MQTNLNRRSRALQIVASVFFFVIFISFAHAAELRTVALTGHPAPGTPNGMVYDTMGFVLIPPIINDSGRVAFLATLKGDGVNTANNRGTWSDGSGSLLLVARSGDQAAGTPSGTNYGGYAPPVINSAGETAFLNVLTGSGVDNTNDHGLWLQGPNGVSLIARTGDAAPGASEGVNFSDFSLLRQLNSAGQTAFHARLAGSGVTSSNNESIWTGSPGALALVARSGTPAPGTPSGTNFARFHSVAPALSETGQTGFLGILTGNEVDSTNDAGIWLQRDTGLSLLARTGDQAPGLPDGLNFRQLSEPLLKATGQVTFTAALGGNGIDSTNDWGIWSDRTGDVAHIVRDGDAAPGTPSGVRFLHMQFGRSSGVNDAGLIAFHALIQGAGVGSSNDSGIWTEGFGHLALLAREGDSATGTSSGTAFDSLAWNPALNNAGQTAFYASLRGNGIDATNNVGIWATDRTGALQLIAREGDPLQVAPGDIRIISSMGLLPGEYAPITDTVALNNLGQIAFRATFTDGTQGVFVSNRVAVPEPSALFLLSLALAAILAARRANLFRPRRALQIPAAMFPLVAFAASAQADIFQWEYINPADPSQGKRQSTTLAPDGAGVDAVPGVDLSGRNLSIAYLIGADLTGAYARSANLTIADLSQANLINAYFTGATLAGAEFIGADLIGADLTGAYARTANLTNADLSQANLTNANFAGATLTDAEFIGAEVRGVSFDIFFDRGFWGTGITLGQLYSTASYLAHDLSGIKLQFNSLGGNFAGQNLTNSDFAGAALTGADFTDANIRGAKLGLNSYGRCPGAEICHIRGTGVTLAQIYSTASYQARDLSGVNLFGCNLAGGDFAGQYLTNAFIYGYYDSSLAGAGLSAADARGAVLDATGAITNNLILPDGHIDGLDLDGSGMLVVRDYAGPTYDPSRHIPITIDRHLTMGPGGTLRMVFEADAWDSTISFAPAIPVTLGGTLELTFADDVNLAGQVDRTLKIFDWTGVTPTGAFAVSSPYRWDLSNLYNSGEVTLASVPESACLTLAATALIVILPRRGHRSSALMNRAASWLTKIVALTLAVALQLSNSYAAVRTVALSGQQAAGTPGGVNFSSFGAHFLTAIARQTYRGPVINNAGQVAFRANLTGSGVDATNNQGIWTEGTGSLALVARTGDIAPGAPEGANFGLNYALELFEPVLNNAGQTAFYGGLTDGTVGLWSEGSGNLALVARDGTPAPGTPDDVNLSFAVLRDFFPGLPKLNDAGQVAFLANVTGAGIDNTNDWGVWSESTGGLGLVARSGSHAPGTPSGVNFDSFFFQSGFNNAGQNAFLAFVAGDGVDPSNDQGIWSEGSGGLALVARSGAPAPGTPSPT